MKNIRIGKDIALKWTVTVDGVSRDLSELDLRLFLHNETAGSAVELAFTTQTDVLRAEVLGRDQRNTGVYRLTLWLNKDKTGQSVLDESTAFRLVARTEMEGGVDDNNLETESVELSGNLTTDGYKDYSELSERVEALEEEMQDRTSADDALRELLDSRVRHLGQFANIDALYNSFKTEATAGSHLMYGELASGARVTHSALCVSISSDKTAANGFVQYVFASSTKYGVGLWSRQVYPNGQGGRAATDFVKVGDGGMSLSGSTLTLRNDAGATLATLDLGAMPCIAKSSGRDANQMTIKNAAGQVLFTLPYATDNLAGVLTAANKKAIEAAKTKNEKQDTRLDNIEANYMLDSSVAGADYVSVLQANGAQADIAAATSERAGVMSAADKTKLDKLVVIPDMFESAVLTEAEIAALVARAQFQTPVLFNFQTPISVTRANGIVTVCYLDYYGGQLAFVQTSYDESTYQMAGRVENVISFVS